MRAHIFAVLIALLATACASHQDRNISSDDQYRNHDIWIYEGAGAGPGR
jgi:uncharacterized protein YcfL